MKLKFALPPITVPWFLVWLVPKSLRARMGLLGFARSAARKGPFTISVEVEDLQRDDKRS